MEKTTNLNIKGMHCKSCEALIKMELEEIGVNKINIDHKTGKASIKYNEDKVSLEEIKSTIKKQGYGVN